MLSYIVHLCAHECMAVHMHEYSSEHFGRNIIIESMIVEFMPAFKGVDERK